MFYYSVQPSEIGSVTLEELEKMNQAIDIFKAQEALLSFKTSSFPHLKEKDRTVIHKYFHKQGFPSVWTGEPRKATLREIAEALAGNNG